MTAPKLNILVIEDEAGVRDFMKEILESEGHAVICAIDGASGIDAAQAAVFDVAIVDYGIPEPNGLEVLENLRMIQPNCVRLLVSGHLDVPATVDAVNRGEAARILQKPFDGDELLNAMKEAMSMRQRVGEQYVWSQAMEHSGEDAHLRECFSKNMLKLVVQPIVITGRKTLFGYEALLRSDHAVLGGPISVIAAAERQGQLARLGTVVAERAAALLAAMPVAMHLFVNLHPSELEHPDSLMQRLTPLNKHAKRVILEITERSKMVDADAWTESTRCLREGGFSLALDDLGAGYSSLAMLAELMPKFIKIDMAIVRHCDTDRRKKQLIELLCRFGEANSSIVIAEGIETESEATAVASAGARLQQGYFFGKPQPL